REFDQLFGKLDCRSVRLVAEQVIKRQLGKLASGGIDEALLAEAQRHAPQSRKSLDVLGSGFVVNARAPSAYDDERPQLLVQAGVGVRMEHARCINCLAGS